MATTGQGRTSVRVSVGGAGAANVETGLSVLDHLLALLAAHASFDLSLEVEPSAAARTAPSRCRQLDWAEQDR